MTFISGPMTGFADYNRKTFLDMEERLKKLNIIVRNPARLSLGEHATWELYMRTNISTLVLCDAIIMLPGWENSKGSSLEHTIASALDINIFYSYEELYEYLLNKRKDK